MDKLFDDFDILTKLKIIHKNLPPSYLQYTELDVFSREMMDLRVQQELNGEAFLNMKEV